MSRCGAAGRVVRPTTTVAAAESSGEWLTQVGVDRRRMVEHNGTSLGELGPTSTRHAALVRGRLAAAAD